MLLFDLLDSIDIFKINLSKIIISNNNIANFLNKYYISL